MAKIAVAPLVGAWIEIRPCGSDNAPRNVAPLVGAWIEIESYLPAYSPPGQVAPLVGAWIEIDTSSPGLRSRCCRSPRGSVD